MSYCINPNCSKPDNAGQLLFCQSCGSELLLQGCYRVLSPLGSGGFGKTYEIEDSGTKKVLKVLLNTVPKAVELFQQEAEVLKKLKHPGIPQVESDGYFIYFPRDSQEPLHCLVMEKIEGMNLEEYMIQLNHKPISERAAVRWLKQVVEILQKVHQQNYFHRNIKPPNIMLRPNGQLVLIDFGTAREVTQTFMQKVAGNQVTGIMTPGYTPREQMEGKAVPQSDFFALGRTFVYLLTGKSPQDFSEDARTGELIWRDHTVGISKKFLDLIDYLMSPFPGNRPQESQDILEKLSQFDTSYPDFDPNGDKSKISNSVNNSQSVINYKYPSFWKRFLAYILDTLISILIIFVFFIIANILYSIFYSSELSIIVFLGGSVIFNWLYFVLWESSKKQSTFGKRICKTVVTNMKGNKISFWRATWRFLVKFLLIISTFGILDFIFVIFNKNNRSLHDILSGTVVVKKQSP